MSDVVEPIIGKICIERGWLTLDQFIDCFKQSSSAGGLRLSDLLVSRGFVDPARMNALREEVSSLLSSEIPEDVARAAAVPKNVLGKYVMVRELGRGGMAAVYKGWDAGLRRWVALKILAGIAGDEDLARFRLEAQTAAALRHPNIAVIYEVLHVEDRYAIAMEYIDGTNLAGLKLDVAKAVTLLVQVARAVEYAHSKGVVHRDLKPHNIMVDREERPFVLDFGFAKGLGGASHLTASGMVLGTPSYMSPEQAEGREIDVRSDIYSLGAVLYEALTGQPPFRGANALETVQRVVNEPVTPPSRFNSSVTPKLERIVLRCLEKDRHRRYPDAKSLARELEQARPKPGRRR